MTFLRLFGEVKYPACSHTLQLIASLCIISSSLRVTPEQMGRTVRGNWQTVYSFAVFVAKGRSGGQVCDLQLSV